MDGRNLTAAAFIQTSSWDPLEVIVGSDLFDSFTARMRSFVMCRVNFGLHGFQVLPKFGLCNTKTSESLSHVSLSQGGSAEGYYLQFNVVTSSFNTKIEVNLLTLFHSNVLRRKDILIVLLFFLKHMHSKRFNFTMEAWMKWEFTEAGQNRFVFAKLF